MSTANMISKLKAESEFKVGDAVVYVTGGRQRGVVTGVRRFRGRFTYAVMITGWSCKLNGLKADWLKPSK